MVKTTMPDRYGELETSSDALAQIAVDCCFNDISGKYFDRSTETKDSSALSYVRANQEELWQKSLEYCGLSGGILRLSDAVWSDLSPADNSRFSWASNKKGQNALFPGTYLTDQNHG